MKMLQGGKVAGLAATFVKYACLPARYIIGKGKQQERVARIYTQGVNIMKRWSIRLFALALACGMLAGCAAKKEVVISASSDRAKETSEAAAGAEAAEEESAEATEPKAEEEPVSEQDEMVPADPVEIDGLGVSDPAVSGCKEDGLYWLPSAGSIVYAVNGTTNGSLQLQSSPPNMLVYSCALTLDSADSAYVEIRVYEDGELLILGGYDVELNEGENSLTAILKLPHDVSGSYRVEMWYDGQPAAFAEM
jgi:hypothetical protein